MAYLGSHTTTPIVPELSCAGYGDIVHIETHGKSEKISEKVVQHNLAAFWQRPGLSPVSAGFPIPLMHAAHYSSNGVYSGPIGSWLASSKVRTLRRNLICSELAEGDDGDLSRIRLFVVNELSDRKTLIESEFSFVNPYCNRRRILKLSAAENPKTIDLPDAALELRVYQTESQTRSQKKVFVRTKDALHLCNTENQSVDKCYGTSIDQYFQVPYLEEDLVIIDSFQHLWQGTIGSNFTRKKLNFMPKSASPTDCPKLILATDGEEVRLVDLRESRESTDVMFKLEEPAFFNRSRHSFMQSLTEMHQNNREEIVHLMTLPDRQFATVASSRRHHFLLDQRVPGVAIVTIAHSIFNGGDYSFVAPPLQDSNRPGFVYNYFTLGHFHEPQVSYWPFYINTHNSIWSSVGPIKTLQMPQVLERYSLAKPGLFPVNFDPCNFSTRTRSLCYQALSSLQSVGDTRALIFRQMDGGDIWYNNFIIDPTTDQPIDQRKYRSKSFEAVETYFEVSEDADCFRLRATGRMAANEILKDPQIYMRCYEIYPELEEIATMEELTSDPDPFAEIGVPLISPTFKADDLEIQETADEDKIFSTIILKSWAKSDIAFMNYLAGTRGESETRESVASEDITPSSPYQPKKELKSQSTSQPPKIVPFEEEEEFNFDEMDFNSD